MSDVVWAQDALEDLDSAITYIANDNPVAAGRVLDRIETAAENLGKAATGRGQVAGTYEKSVRDLLTSWLMRSSLCRTAATDRHPAGHPRRPGLALRKVAGVSGSVA